MSSCLKAKILLVVLLVAGAPIPVARVKAADAQVTFEGTTSGRLPQGWRVEATNPSGPLAHWEVATDTDARSPSHVLSVTEITDRSRGHFNLAWTPGITFQDGEIEVAVRANTGRVDQGGGPMWRVRDANNYYIARYNPLESNFRIYYVKDGDRRELASAEDIDIPAGRWFTIRIVHRGEHIEGWVDGEKRLEFDDGTFADAGGVGLWTKADAATSFDELTVRSE